mgnify:CR=1 FL=1
MRDARVAWSLLPFIYRWVWSFGTVRAAEFFLSVSFFFFFFYFCSFLFCLAECFFVFLFFFSFS